MDLFDEAGLQGLFVAKFGLVFNSNSPNDQTATGEARKQFLLQALCQIVDSLEKIDSQEFLIVLIGNEGLHGGLLYSIIGSIG